MVVDSSASSCMALAESILARGLLSCSSAEQQPTIGPVSIAIGHLEQHFTSSQPGSSYQTTRDWPTCLEEEINVSQNTFDIFVNAMADQLAARGLHDTRAKVKGVADAVWSKLTGVFSKDIHHAQHVSCFVRHLTPQAAKAKRQLDCAGVVTTVLAICQALSKHPGHQDLAQCRFQVSEDHCWITLGPDHGSREASMEVTTDTAAKRGLPVGEEAWQTWLYNGGQAVVCSSQMALTAVVTSINPSINPRQNTGNDSTEVQLLQHRLLTYLNQHHPEAMYPAAICALADLHEIAEQDELDAAAATEFNAGGECAADPVHALLQKRLGGAQELFERAMELSRKARFGNQHHWYPFSYAAGFHARLADWCLQLSTTRDKLRYREVARSHVVEALNCCSAGNGAAVLCKFRFATHDEQLYKDVEGVLELLCDSLSKLRRMYDEPLADIRLLSPLLELFDGVCWLLRGRAKPAGWVNCLLKAAKGFTAVARASAALTAQTTSDSMERAKPQWEQLRPTSLKAIFEAAEVDHTAVRQIKRPKR